VQRKILVPLVAGEKTPATAKKIYFIFKRVKLTTAQFLQLSY
jgi:hypothetical protein